MVILLARHNHEVARDRGGAFIAADTDSTLAGAGAEDAQSDELCVV